MTKNGLNKALGIHIEMGNFYPARSGEKFFVHLLLQKQ